MIENDTVEFDRIRAITEAGEMFVWALGLGRCGRDSLGYRAARMWSERACEWGPKSA